MVCVLRTNFFAGRQMSIIPGLRVSALADWLSRPSGRHQRRQWTGNGRAHIEVKGVHRREHVELARQVQDEPAQLDGVHWAIGLAVATAASFMAPLMARLPAIAAVAQQLARSLRAVPEAGP